MNYVKSCLIITMLLGIGYSQDCDPAYYNCDCNEDTWKEYYYSGGHNMQECYLVGANLSGAWLADANLSGADLSGAILYGALPAYANLHYANFEGAPFLCKP